MTSASSTDNYGHLGDDAKLAFLKTGYDALVQREQRNDRRLKRGERQRATIFVVMLLVLIVASTGLVLGAYQQWSSSDKTAIRNEQHDDTQRQIRMLACTAVQFAPPGNKTTDQLRHQYRCPSYAGPPTRTPASP